MQGAMNRILRSFVEHTSNMNETVAPQTSGPPAPDSNRSWAIGCHLSPMLAFVGLPLAHLLGPLVIWLLKKHESAYLDEQGREALNFHLSVTVYFLGLIFLGVLPGALVLSMGRVLAPLGIAWIALSVFGILMLLILDFVMIIVAAVKTSEGTRFRYPLTIRFV